MRWADAALIGGTFGVLTALAAFAFHIEWLVAFGLVMLGYIERHVVEAIQKRRSDHRYMAYLERHS